MRENNMVEGSQRRATDTCRSVHILGLDCRHGHHHEDCSLYTKSQEDKGRYCREPIPLSQLEYPKMKDKKSNE